MNTSSSELALRLASATPSFLCFDDEDEMLPEAPEIDESEEALVRYAAFAELFPDFIELSSSVLRDPPNTKVGPSAETVAPGECFARAAIRLYERTSTGATNVDRTSSCSPECPLCYERKANRIVLGCGHSACVSCLEKAVAASNDSCIAKCFKCRLEPGVIVRAYE
jgi:hypothetical protein